MTETIQHQGGCHCGAVRFRFRAPPVLKAMNCNCSICKMTNYQHVIVGCNDFELLTGSTALGDYKFNTGTAQHRFCKHCGIKSFYIPRSHPEGFSVNLRCVDPITVKDVELADFDGENWEASIDSLR